jgi:hypothetical protein
MPATNTTTPVFDAAKAWEILAPGGDTAPAAKTLAAAIVALRGGETPAILDALNTAAVVRPRIILDYDPASRKTSFAWRTAPDHIEIYAHSPASLEAACADFLTAMGFTPNPNGALSPPPPQTNNLYPLAVKARHSFGV